MAREWMRFLVPLSGRTAKAIVVDLDNTLWGGIIGEDGMTGIKIGAEYPGAAYQALQRALLDLSRRGILLAICSKNNLDDAMEALEKHPGMLVRSKSFAAMRINWGDKSQNLREIAQELNIGLDSLAFLDDNPFEREQVRAALPEVTVIDLPQNPLEYATIVRDCPIFERLTLSAEDQQRTAMYAEQRQRSDAEQNFQSKEDFFRFLEQEAELKSRIGSHAGACCAAHAKDQPVQPDHAPLQRGPDCRDGKAAGAGTYFQFACAIALATTGWSALPSPMTRASKCELDTFLLSCRVIGRTVETALLAHIAKSASATRLQTTRWMISSHQEKRAGA